MRQICNKNTKNKKIFIVTGMSGAGKSQALKIFEDFGFYCVDNLPAALLINFIKLTAPSGRFNNVAIGVDIREGVALKKIPKILNDLKQQHFCFRLLFLDASDNILVQRFSQTRHKHPLGKNISNAIKVERRKISKLREVADKHIDTSSMTLSELKENVSKILEVKRSREMKLSVMSFGYKYGIPVDADIIMDVRFLKNPNYRSSLKNKTGLHKSVANYIRKDKNFAAFSSKLHGLIKYLLPLYINEGKSYLTIAIGCTGGKHRSVYTACELSIFLKKINITVSEYHRDIKKK
jgi:UPF0042 nucleotide-binding protein